MSTLDEKQSRSSANQKGVVASFLTGRKLLAVAVGQAISGINLLKGLVWWAATPQKGDYEMLAQARGEGAPTFTNTELLLPDHEGVYNVSPANSPTWHGARLGGGAGSRQLLTTRAGWTITDGGAA